MTEQSAFDKYNSAHDKLISIGEAIASSRAPITTAEVEAFLAANAERKVARGIVLADLSPISAFEVDMRSREAKAP